MNRLTLAIGLALLCAIAAHAQDTTVIIKDPDPPTPAIKETTTTTTTDHYDTVSTSSAHKAVHHSVHHYPVHRAPVAYHHPVTSHAVASHVTDTQTTTQTTVTTPAHESTAVVSQDADGNISVSTTRPVEAPADPDDGKH